MPSRRTFLAGAAGVGVVAVGGASQVRPGSVESWTPRDDTWPLGRYGPANTAANPGATAPTDPAVAWKRAVLSGDLRGTVVVGRDAVYAGGGGVAALDRDDGTVRWHRNVTGGPLALWDGTLYVAPAWVPDDGSAVVAAYDASDGTERWHVDADRHASRLLVADGTVFVGDHGRLAAYDAHDGTHRWTDDFAGNDEVRPAVQDGTLYAAVEDLVRYRSRSLLEDALGWPPAREWAATHVYDPYVPAVAGDRIVVGSTDLPGSPAEPGLVAIDPADGDLVWSTPRSTLLPAGFGDHVTTRTPAIVGDRGFTGLRFGAGEDRRHAVGAVSLTDGTAGWRRSVGQPIFDVAATHDAVLVATNAHPDRHAEPPGTVLAFEPADGSDRWHVPFDHGVDAVAAVDGTVFVATAGGRVAALR